MTPELHAKLQRDAEAAKKRVPQPWRVCGYRVLSGLTEAASGCANQAIARHIANWDPSTALAVLAEVERLQELYAVAAETADAYEARLRLLRCDCDDCCASCPRCA